MCRAFEETRNEASLRRAISIAEKMITKGKLSLEEVAEYTELSLEKVQELAGVRPS